MTLYKFLYLKDGKLVSSYGDLEWKIGEWQTVKGKLVRCENGLHASEKPLDALLFVPGDVLAIVEGDGKSIAEDDKQVWQKMRITKAYKWTKKDSVALSIFSAELCLANYENLYPGDNRVREAIDAAKLVLKSDTKKNREAARSAQLAAQSAAWSARLAVWSAAQSVWSAARSAESAQLAARSARSAESAARSAAQSAWSAARSAQLAAWSAAWSAAQPAARSAESAALDEINNWIVEHIKKMKEIK